MFARVFRYFLLSRTFSLYTSSGASHQFHPALDQTLTVRVPLCDYAQCLPRGKLKLHKGEKWCLYPVSKWREIANDPLCEIQHGGICNTNTHKTHYACNTTVGFKSFLEIVDPARDRICRDPEVRANRGGRRGMVHMYLIEEFFPVSHEIFPNDPLYDASLWMKLDYSRFQPTTLWYMPQRVLQVSDYIDLARIFGLDYIPLNHKDAFTGRSQLAELYLRAQKDLDFIDTIVFSDHLSHGQMCPRNPAPGCCKTGKHGKKSYMQVQMVTNNGWQAFTCPAHRALRRGKNPGQCTCSVPQTISMSAGDSPINESFANEHRWIC